MSSTVKGAARRAAIIDSAAAILASEGHAALSLRAVAAATGIRLGNLQYYFATRADLVAALLDRQLDAALHRLGDILAPPVDAGAVVDALLAEQCDRALVAIFYELWAMAAHDEAVAAAVRSFYRRYAELVAGVVVAACPAVGAEAARGRARAFVALLEGASLLRSGVAGAPDDGADATLRRLAVALVTDAGIC